MFHKRFVCITFISLLIWHRVSLFEFHFSALCNFTFYRYRSAIPVIEQEVQLHFSVPYSRYGDNNLTRDSVQKSGT